MRDFLMELYLQYGDRPFMYRVGVRWLQLSREGFILPAPDNRSFQYKLTPKALELIKNDS